MSQLPDDLLDRFPAILTRKFAIDKSIVGLMRGRTLGNSPTAACHAIQELHAAEWMQATERYLSDCKRHKESRKQFTTDSFSYSKPPPFTCIPQPPWFLSCYVRDVFSRLDVIKAAATNVVGSILKIDSTKKIVKKLQGEEAQSAAWCTNVGNERGEILLSLLTTSESLSNLDKMAKGLMKRYADAQQPAPLALYTDRDCCVIDGSSKFNKLFDQWPELKVRMDSWHFMRRLAKAVANESHPLYGTFMSKISAAIFEWDQDDVDCLRKAKRSALVANGIPNPSDETVTQAITKQELAQHCKRKIRSVESITCLLNCLL